MCQVERPFRVMGAEYGEHTLLSTLSQLATCGSAARWCHGQIDSKADVS
jgi:hypothetical protein